MTIDNEEEGDNDGQQLAAGVVVLKLLTKRMEEKESKAVGQGSKDDNEEEYEEEGDNDGQQLVQQCWY